MNILGKRWEGLKSLLSLKISLPYKFLFSLILFSFILLNFSEARVVRGNNLSYPTLSRYEEFIGTEGIQEIVDLANLLKGRKILEVNTTEKGGGVAEMLQTLVPLFQELGINAKRSIFNVADNHGVAETVKKLFNAFQGKEDVSITETELRGLDDFARKYVESSIEEFRNSDVVVLHDAAIVIAPIVRELLRGEAVPKIIWRIHYDSSKPSEQIKRFVEEYGNAADRVVYSMPDYVIEGVETPPTFIHPAIDHLTEKNKELPPDEIKKIISEYNVDPKKPILLQVSRFDYFKDPEGVILIYKEAKKKIKDLQLVLIGGSAGDDPEGARVLEKVRKEAGDDKNIHIIIDAPDIVVNAFQRGAKVVIQASLKESFGLVITEAMLKRKSPVASDVGGIKYQITDNMSGFLVPTDLQHPHSPERIGQFANYVVTLIENAELREQMGERAFNFARDNFLIPRLLKDRLELFIDVLGLPR